MAYLPQDVATYKDNQIIINSDRLVFNTKKDSILLFSDKAIGFSTNGSFHFDTSPDKAKSKFVLNSPNIYLGLTFDDKLPTEPAVLGDELHDLLHKILDTVYVLTADIEYKISYMSTTPGTPTGMNPANKSALRNRYKYLEQILNDLDSIDSINTKLV